MMSHNHNFCYVLLIAHDGLLLYIHMTASIQAYLDLICVSLCPLFYYLYCLCKLFEKIIMAGWYFGGLDSNFWCILCQSVAMLLMLENTNISFSHNCFYLGEKN